MEAELFASLMLFGATLMLLTLLPVLLSSNEAIRHTAWFLFSNALKIVCAMMIGGSFAGMVVWTMGTAHLLLIHGCLYATWYIVLQLALLYRVHLGRKKISVTCGPHAVDKKAEHWNLLEKEEMHDIELSLEADSPLVSVTCAVSGMFFWAQIQIRLVQSAPQHMAIPFALSAVLAVFIFSEILVSFLQWIRSRFMGLDGITDNLESLWNTYIVQCERSLVCFQVAFLLLQALKFGITGQMPPPGPGMDPPGFQASQRDIVLLLCFSGLFIVTFFVMHYKGFANSHYGGVFAQSMGLSTTLCWWYSSMWFWTLHFGSAAFGAICEAAATTMFSLTLIVLMAILRTDWKNKQLEQALKLTVTMPMSVWIGFSWKKAFQSAFMTLNGTIHYFDPPVQSAMLSVLFLCVLLPSWLWYVLPQEYGLRKQLKAPEIVCVQCHIKAEPVPWVNGLYQRQQGQVNKHPCWQKLEDPTKLLLWRDNKWYITNSGDENAPNKTDWLVSIQEENEVLPLPESVRQWACFDKDGSQIPLDKVDLKVPVPVLKFRGGMDQPASNKNTLATHLLSADGVATNQELQSKFSELERRLHALEGGRIKA